MTERKKSTENFISPEEEIKNKFIGGLIGAISLDTCIFARCGYQLNDGLLGELKQFKNSDLKLVLTEIVLREVNRHITAKSSEEISRLNGALNGVRKFWKSSAEAAKNAELLLTNGVTPESLAKSQIEGLLKNSGAITLHANKYANLKSVLSLYFDNRLPFEEGKKDKKSEFPDAISLLSLDKWASDNKTLVLLVTTDIGCLKYCQDSESLIGIDDLTKALRLIQERDAHKRELAESIDEKLSICLPANFLNIIQLEIEGDIWKIDWIPDASSAFYFDAELDDILVRNVQLIDVGGSVGLESVNFSNGCLVGKLKINVEIEASCNFNFEVKDGIDKDMISIGGAYLTRTQSIELEVLISFSNPSIDNIDVIDVQLISGRKYIDFGDVEPDYENDEPED